MEGGEPFPHTKGKRLMRTILIAAALAMLVLIGRVMAAYNEPEPPLSHVSLSVNSFLHATAGGL